MHPAYSVIFFTTASGAGYGLLALMGVFGATGLLPADRWFGLTGLAIALGLITAGLLSSTFHLGRPERAWRAYSQWRSSWLSREGILATATYLPAGLYAIGWMFMEKTTGPWGFLGVLSALMAAWTVYCTAMIYATLRPIHAWCNQWTMPNYLAMALLTGALLLNALTTIFGVANPQIALMLVVALFLAFFLKRKYWRFIDTTRGPTSPESATGLGGLGKVRLLDAPNTQANFVQKEMGYRIARKHVAKLRRLTFIGLFVVPLVLSMAAVEGSQGLAVLCTVLAVLSAAVGVAAERWLFFAEAEHSVAHYYGAEAV